jgi:small subunit ribosomal protein S3Ae
MAIGKNKRVNKGGKRGNKKQIKEPMSRKEWYDVVAPTSFKTRQFTKTICNKTQGIKIASDNIRGRVFEANLADLDGNVNRDQPYRKVKRIAQDVIGRTVLTQFHSMSLTTDKLRSMVRQWCTTVESLIDAKTSDGHTMRLFIICFTARQANQLSKNCYSATRLEKWLRFRMTKITQKRISKCTIDQAVTQLTRDHLTDTLYKRCHAIVPIRDVKITQVKLLKTPRFESQKLLDSHGEIPESNEDKARVVTAAPEAAPVAAAAE